MKRRSFIKTFGSASVIPIAGCLNSSENSSENSEYEEYTDEELIKQVLEDYEKIMNNLRSLNGSKKSTLDLMYSRDYTRLNERLRDLKIDISEASTIFSNLVDKVDVLEKRNPEAFTSYKRVVSVLRKSVESGLEYVRHLRLAAEQLATNTGDVFNEHRREFSSVYLVFKSNYDKLPSTESFKKVLTTVFLE